VLIAAGVVSTLVVVGKGAAKSGGSASPSRTAASHTITIPASAAGYTHITGNIARRLVAETRKRAAKAAGKVSGAWGEAYAKAKIGFYTRGSALRPLVFIGFSATDTPQVASVLRSQPPSEALDSFFLGAGVANTRDFPAGPLGGVLRCGKTTRASVPVTMCAWTDSSVLAVVAEAGISKSGLARVALAFRGAAEH